MEPASAGLERPRRRARILVVEDDPALRRVMELLLSEQGWMVESVTDGKAALGVLRERVPDLVITDVVMPGKGGFGVLRELRADPRTRRLPIILMSVISEEDSRVKALEAGANDYLIKPFSDRELVARVSTQLEMALQRQQAAEEGESRFRAVSDHAPVLIFMAGAEGLTNFVNARAVDFTGMAAEELTGHGWVDAIHPEDRLRALEAYRQAFQARRSYEIELRMRRRDGADRWMLVAGAPRFDAGGEFAGFVGFALDITERRQREEDRRDSEAELRAILDGAIDAVIGMDVGGLVNFWNPRAEAIFGWTRDEVMGKDMAELVIPPHLRESHRAGLQSFLASGQERLNRRMEVSALRRDGSEFPAELTIIVFRKGEGYTCTAFVADITIRKGAEAERTRLLAEAEEARAQAEAANRMKDEFLATLSHELRTPLNAIVGWVHLLRAGRLDEGTAQRALETIDRNAKIQTQLISDILDVSRIVSGKLRVSLRPLEVAPLVESALDTVLPAAEAKGIQLQAQLDPRAGPVLGDPDRLQQVVWNLVSNAIKFTPDGGRVEVELSRLDAHVQLRIADNGIGISPEFLPHVFERFRQADASSTRPQGGLGLGLAIVRHLVEVHGGTVTAESPGPGQGSTFAVRLPLMDLTRPAPDAARMPPVAEQAAGFAGPPLEGVVVLVVDDDEEARQLTTRVLQERGAEVLTAASPEQALEAVKRHRPDVLITHLDGRGEESVRLIRALREIPPDRGGLTPAALLSDGSNAEQRMKWLLAGYQIHLAKPVEPAELATVVASLAGRTRDLFHA